MITSSTKSLTMILLAALVSASLFMISCEGPAGKDGLAGTDGKNGQEQCATCHNSSNLLFAKQLQWANSQHGVGTTFERSGTSCAPCHTSDGFHEVLASGAFNTAAEVQNPTGQNCRTCHFVHRNSNDTDWELTKVGEVKFRVDTTLTHNFGKGASCATCHQARTYSPVLNLEAETYTVANNRFGPHYATAANTFIGKGAIEIAGPVPYSSTLAHKNAMQNTCVDCHMGKAFGAQAGGHTMKMTYNEGTSDNVAVCTGCHADATKFDFRGTQTEVKTLMAELKQKLTDKNMVDGEGYPKAGTYPTKQAAALYNYRFIYADHSYGIHNPKYIVAVLKNSIAALD